MLHTTCYILLVTCFTSCFTGVESTPKITSREVKRQHAVVTPEMDLIANLSGQPVAEWSAGKEFIYTGGKISYTMSPIQAAEKLQPGDAITFLGANPVASLTEIDDTQLAFSTPAGDTLYYRVNESPDAVTARQSLSIPFLVERYLVDSTSRLLAGNDFYIKTPVWFNEDGDNIDGRKLIKVHVDSVTAGNTSYPLAVYFTDLDGNHSHVYMTASPGSRSSCSFDALFSIANPRERYKDIKPDVWECITRSQVKAEMTREECRLSLGAPREISRAHYVERWIYDNGMILFFDDGYLQRIGHR